MAEASTAVNGRVSRPSRDRFRLASGTTAVALGALSLLSVPATFALSILIHQAPSSTSDFASGAAGVAFVLAFTAVGVVVALRLPRNPMGWMLIAVALVVQAATTGSANAYLDYTLHDGALPLGSVALLLKLSTGVLVLFAYEESFTLMTPQGHMFAGWITFSAFTQDGATHAQAQVLMRASDPLYELGLAFGGHRQEDLHWVHTLRSLASYFGAEDEVAVERVCVDRRREWSRIGNVRQNAGIGSAMHMVGAPFRAVRRPRRPPA